MMARRCAVWSGCVLAAGLCGSGGGAWADDGGGWTADLDYLHLHRTAGDTPLFTDGRPVSGNVIATTGSLGGTGASGIAVGLSGSVGDFTLDVRGSFTEPATARFGIADFDPVFPPSGSQGVSIAHDSNAGAGLFPSDDGALFDLSAERTTTFHSLEANMAKDHRRGRVFAGLRGLVIDDEISATIEQGSSLRGFLARSSNTLAGPQLGASASWSPADRLQVRAFGSAAVFHVRSTADTSRFGPFVPASPADDTARAWTLGFETGVDGTFDLAGNLRLSAGYRLLHIDRVGAAGATINASFYDVVVPIEPNATVGYEAVTYHGGTIGLTLRF